MIPPQTPRRTTWVCCACIGLIILSVSACVTPTADRPGPSVQPLRITAVGDLMLDGSAREKVEEHGYDYPFAKTRHLFAGSQIVFANLEGPLTTRGTEDKDKRYVYRSPPDKVAPALKRAGINVVSLANNHAMDYGQVGLRDTITALKKNGIKYVGAGATLAEARQAQFFRIGKITVAVLAYSLTFPESAWATARQGGTAFGHERHIRADVSKARRRADIVIVSFHWGREKQTTLRPYQPQLAHAAIDAGAQLILGHHPHVLQGIENYRQGIILYSLGNYAFGSYSRRNPRSAVAQISFARNRVSEVRLIPINVNNIDVLFQPTPLTGATANEVVAQLQQLSQPLGVTLINDNGVAVWRPPATDSPSPVAATGRSE